MPVSVVIPTHNRCEACKSAVESVLAQDPPPCEVLVCDDGSGDSTQDDFTRLAATEPRLRYLRTTHHGTPAHARNLGIQEATCEWVAFLDDDDRWLPGKLAVQVPFLEVNDVVGGDAIRSSGSRYFGTGESRPRRLEIERANPVIISTSIVRRSLLLDTGGFDEDPLIAGVEDYDVWLRLADRGARFLIVDEPLVWYRDHGPDRLSNHNQAGLLRMRLRRMRAHPRDCLVLVSALREVYNTARLLASRTK